MRQADDMILISVDDHIAEPADMFDATFRTGTGTGRRASSPTKRVSTVVVRRQEGPKPRVERRGGQAARDVQRQSDELRATCGPAATTSTSGSATCQPEASWPGLNFPNWTGFSGQVLNEGPDPELNEIMIKAYNDWHVDEWCAAYPERFIPCGILPLFDVDKAAARCTAWPPRGATP